GNLDFSMNVIVGKTTNSTVIFSGSLQYVVFAPYWNVPKSIVQNEIVPGMAKNPDYLENHNMEIVGQNGSLPDVRQKPGEDNSLGRVKFLFPNNYDIYFHDTPNRDLFSATNRSFSHGCIRVGEPKKLAEFLLRNDSSWTINRIDSAMYASKEKWVKTPKVTPVIIAYFTAWVDDNGLLNFRNDIYGHDQKLIDKMFVSK
ncbi:MAG: L,D-transpeptidase family protein, partial [Chitinophagaceae bacterium]